MDTINELFHADADIMKTKLQEILDVAQDINIELDPGPIVTGSLTKIRDWITLARNLGKLHYSPQLGKLTSSLH
jgi:hypothetical protein